MVKSGDMLSDLPRIATRALREWGHIARRNEVEKQLRFQAQMLDSVRESVVATDLNGNVIYWGKGTETLYGYQAEEEMEKPITFIEESSEVEEEEDRIRQVRLTGKWSGQYKQTR